MDLPEDYPITFLKCYFYLIRETEVKYFKRPNYRKCRINSLSFRKAKREQKAAKWIRSDFSKGNPSRERSIQNVMKRWRDGENAPDY